MPISTKDYLERKKTFEDNIKWYTKTIDEIDRQQSERRKKLDSWREHLYKLEKDYYTNG